MNEHVSFMFLAALFLMFVVVSVIFFYVLGLYAGDRSEQLTVIKETLCLTKNK